MQETSLCILKLLKTVANFKKRIYQGIKITYFFIAVKIFTIDYTYDRYVADTNELYRIS